MQVIFLACMAAQLQAIRVVEQQQLDLSATS
jgi:hypothetical protein